MNKIYNKGIQKIEDALDLVKIIKYLRDSKVVIDEIVKSDTYLKKIYH